MENSKWLEPVLRYLRAGTRFQLSERCPSIRPLEKNTVLHIKLLQLCQDAVNIDDSLLYEISVVEDHVHPIGLDLDEHCSIDMDIQVEQKQNEILIDNRSEELARANIDYEQNLITREKRRIANLPNEEERVKPRAALDRRTMIHQMKSLRLISSITNIPPLTVGLNPIEHHMSFSIHRTKSGNDGYLVKITTIHEERLTYDKKLHDAQFYILEKLFGGRSCINVLTLSIDSIGILRIPSNLNLKFQGLDCYEYEPDNILKALRPFLTPSVLPLKTLQICSVPEMPHPIVESAEELTLITKDRLITLTNLKVTVLSYDMKSVEEPAELIKKWLRDGKQIGTVFTLSSFKEIKSKILLDDVKRRFKEKIVRVEESNGDLTSVTLSMNDSAELVIQRDLVQNTWKVILKVQSSREEEI
ncbi:F-box C protein [Caenorhabditis elegans]|uniref:F-box C protein n=1 Tax=Caenorhabditis elegans TaxID=6239 RepID=Q9TZG1_CAEEL|nr:F-box C protein [Caenorhabditis elegans]CCD71275.1 F-box C protein [Caenorhabditis elegans]|eukprot:NP_494044.2 F-box C protein [Caenorhabditis elegans]